MTHVDPGSSSVYEDSSTEQSTTIRSPGLETSERTRPSQDLSSSASSDQSSRKDNHIEECVAAATSAISLCRIGEQNCRMAFQVLRTRDKV